MRYKLIPWLWCIVFLFVGIGVGAAVLRVLAIRDGVSPLFEPIRSTIPASVVQDLIKYDRAFVKNAVLTFLHIVPASIFLILAPLQFSSTIRNRNISFHRWSGRLVLLIGVFAGLFGLFIRVPFRFTGLAATSAVIVFGVLFLFALIRAFIAIRIREVALHREWMIRAFSIAIGISTIRIVGGLMVLISERPSYELLGWSFWIGWTLSLAVGEFWIRRNPFVPASDRSVRLDV